MDGITVPRGYLQIIEDAMVGQGLGLEIKDNRVLASPSFIKSNICLRPYQEQAKYQLLCHPNGMLVAPAASGKTIIGLDLVASLHQKALWLTHTDRLMKQVVDRIIGTDDMPPAFADIHKKEIGILGGGKFKIGERITIGMIPTLVRREVDLPSIGREFGLVILDEAHHAPANTFLKVLSYFSSFYMYGLTATPYRRDLLEDMMFASIGLGNAVIKRKEISKSLVTPSVKVRHINSVTYDGNDYNYIISELLLNDETRATTIVQDIVLEAQQGNHCIVISTRKTYCELLKELISRFWLKTGIATGDYSKKHNDAQVKLLESGEITVLITTFELLGEGFDVAKLNRGFIALPFRERSRVEQAVGRIQRTSEGKTDAVLYDYVDNNIGVLKNQFINRALTYRKLNMEIREMHR